MKNKIVVNFKSILPELESKNIKLCFLKNRGIFIEDNQNNMYQMDISNHGSYLDKLIKDGTTIEFDIVDISISKNIGEWEKEIWGIPEVSNFMKRQHLL